MSIFFILEDISLRHSSYYGGPQPCHGKSKNLTAKSKYPTTKPKNSRQNQRSHGKTKYFTAKNQTPHGKSKYPRQNQSHFAHCETFGFAVGFLLLFAVRYLVFAVRFLFLPWHGCGPPYSSHMTQKKKVLTGIVSNKHLFLCSQNALLHALLVLLCFKKDTLIMNKKSAASFNIS